MVALACAVGTLIPSALAMKSDDFGSGQAGYVAITCLIAILATLSLLPLGAGGRPARGGVIAGWLIAGYVVLETLPWTRNIFNLGMPHKGTILSARWAWRSPWWWQPPRPAGSPMSEPPPTPSARPLPVAGRPT